MGVAEERGNMADTELELLSKEFETAADKAKSQINPTMENDELLELYALFKQGSIGDVNTEAPGLLDVKGKAKWNAKKGMERKNAMLQYIEFVQKMAEKHGTKE